MRCSLGISNFLEETSAAAAAKLLQSCPTLCDPIDGSPPGSPVPGILQARTLEWGAIAFSEYNASYGFFINALYQNWYCEPQETMSPSP